MYKMRITSAALAALLSASAGTAFAGGFQLTEQSALALGRAYAGVGVDGTDLSGAFYNPSTIVLHSGTQIQTGGVAVALNLPYESAGTQYDQNGRKKPEFVPHFYVTHQLNDKAWVGLSVTVPFGLATDYSQNWQQTDRGYRAEIKLVEMSPSFAYKLTDKLSLGAAFDIQYVKAKLGFNYSVTDADIKVDSLAYGYTLGAMWSPLENVRLGVGYHSKVTHHSEGDMKYVGGTTDAKITMDAPSYWIVSGAWDVNNWLSLYTTFRKTDWSSFSSLTLESPAVLLLTRNATNQRALPMNWRDTYLYTVGYDARINDFWTLRGGLGYERSAVSDARYRTGTIPDADRLWVAIGSSFHWTKSFQTDVSFAHLHGMHERSLYDRTGHEIGDFKRLDAYLFGIQAQYRF